MIKRYLEFTTEGLVDLRANMRQTGQSQKFNPLDFNREEKADIESMGGVPSGNTAILRGGEIITKSPDGFSLEKSGNEVVFIRIGKLITIPSDWQVFKNSIESYLD